MGSRRQTSSLGMRNSGSRTPSSPHMHPQSQSGAPPPSPYANSGPSHERLTRQPSHHARSAGALRAPAPQPHSQHYPPGTPLANHYSTPQTHSSHPLYPTQSPAGASGSGSSAGGSIGGPGPPRVSRQHSKAATSRYWETVLDRPGPGPNLQRQDSVPLPGVQQSRAYSSNAPGRMMPTPGFPSSSDGPHAPYHNALPTLQPTAAPSSSVSMSQAGAYPTPFSGIPGNADTATSSVRRRHKCPHCDSNFDSRFEMRVHITREHKAKAVLDKYPCKVASCDKVFTHRSSRCRHEKQAHGHE